MHDENTGNEDASGSTTKKRKLPNWLSASTQEQSPEKRLKVKCMADIIDTLQKAQTETYQNFGNAIQESKSSESNQEGSQSVSNNSLVPNKNELDKNNTHSLENNKEIIEDSSYSMSSSEKQDISLKLHQAITTEKEITIQSTKDSRNINRTDIIVKETVKIKEESVDNINEEITTTVSLEENVEVQNIEVGIQPDVKIKSESIENVGDYHSQLDKKIKVENKENQNNETPTTSASKDDDKADVKVSPLVALVVKEEPSASNSLRPSCKFGIKCYRGNPIHRIEEAHPGDLDYRRPNYPDPPKGTPPCPYGNMCYRRNPAHFQQFSHPIQTNFHQNLIDHQNRLRDRKPMVYNVEFSDDDSVPGDFSGGSEDEYDPVDEGELHSTDDDEGVDLEEASQETDIENEEENE